MTTLRRLAIIAWRPHYGRESNLVALLDQRLSCLRDLGLATQREAVLGRTDSNEVIEIFEWSSSDAIALAQSHPAALRIMRRIVKVAELVVPADLPAARELFFEITPIDPIGQEHRPNVSLWKATHGNVPQARSNDDSPWAD